MDLSTQEESWKTVPYIIQSPRYNLLLFKQLAIIIYISIYKYVQL